MHSVTLLLCAITAVMLAIVNAHGSATKPRFRGTVKTSSLTLPELDIDDVETDFCPHCLNGGGKGTVMEAADNNWRPWEPLTPGKFRHDSGLCGDPIKKPAPRPHEKGGAFGPSKKQPYMAVYKKNQIVEFTIDMTTNHNGFFEFFICDVGKCGGDINEKCFKDGHCYQLMRAKVPECENSSSKECGPIDPDYPGRWIVPCRKGGHVGEHFMGGKYMQYHLPKNFACQDCVIQWYWATANSCNPPGFKEYFDKYPMKQWGRCPGDGGASGGRSPGLSECGGPTFPEEFWNCADVRVTANGANLSKDSPADVKVKKSIASASTMEKKKQAPTVGKATTTPMPMATPRTSTKPMPVSSATVALDCAKHVENRNPGKKKTVGQKGAKCANIWGQCGGASFNGPTECCDANLECVASNKYYAQCRPAGKAM